MLQSALDSLVADANFAEFNQKLDLVVIKSYLRTVLEREKGTTGFILGGVTFCAMLPMRSIPFKVICLLGMNSDAFPRDSKTVSFDLIASYPRLGDRSRREDDKYLFLEALISAREKFYISYIGQSIQDNTRLVPCVLVSELMDYLQDRFSLAAIDLIQYHPLQAFSQAYFSEDSHFFSYSRENFEAVVQAKSIAPMPGNGTVDISPPADDWRHVEIQSLCQYFKNPTRFLLQKRLGISLEEQVPVPDDYENFKMTHLDEYSLAQDLFDAYVKGGQPEALFPSVKARGILPHGAIGQFDFQRMCGNIRQFAVRWKQFSQGLQPVELPIELEFHRFNITGKIPAIYGDVCVQARYTRFNPGDLICTWIYHLIRSSIAPESLRASWYISRDTTIELRPILDSESILLDLLNTYWKGLSESIHLFPFASYNYARQVVLYNANPDKAIRVAANKWANDFGWSEANDPYIAHCFKDKDPLDDQFRDLATSVFGPILKNHRELKGQ